MPESNKFSNKEYFMDDLNAKTYPKYKANSDIVITEETYSFCIDLVKKHLEGKKGDILIFVPGLF